jgi:hypothetical protein
VVTVADVSVFSIGAPFWGLLAGLAVSWLLEAHAAVSSRAHECGAASEEDIGGSGSTEPTWSSSPTPGV